MCRDSTEFFASPVATAAPPPATATTRAAPAARLANVEVVVMLRIMRVFLSVAVSPVQVTGAILVIHVG